MSEFLEIRKCGSCGKDFAVLYPQMWRFKRKTGTCKTYFCSWGCLREWEYKGVDKMGKGERRDRIEIAKKIIEMGKAGQGGAPVMDYLTGIGYKNPVQAVHDIKMYVKKAAPEIYDQWPVLYKGKATTIGEMYKGNNQAAKIKEEPLPVQDLKLEPGGNYRISLEAEKQKITKPVNYAGFEMMSVRSTETGFRYEWSKECNLFEIHAKGDEMRLCIEDLRKLMKELPEAGKVLGVEI